MLAVLDKAAAGLTRPIRITACEFVSNTIVAGACRIELVEMVLSSTSAISAFSIHLPEDNRAGVVAAAHLGDMQKSMPPQKLAFAASRTFAPAGRVCETLRCGAPRPDRRASEFFVPLGSVKN